jgi:lysophospholipase L1-like esterase
MKYLKWTLVCCHLISGLTAGAQGLTLSEPVRFLALGDSYTIGQSVPVSNRWPVRFMDALASMGMETEPLRIIAQTGWRTDHLKAAIETQQPPQDYTLVSLLIGVNDLYQGLDEEWYQPRFEDLLETSIKLANGKKEAVMVLSIPDYAYTPFGQQSDPEAISVRIDAFNHINRQITENHGIEYFDITPISRQGLERPELVAQDGLHPSGMMYGEWVELILERIRILPSTGSQSTHSSHSVNRVFPNPARDQIRFIPGDHPVGSVMIRLFNVSGSLVDEIISAGKSEISYDSSFLDPGIYFFSMISGKGEINRGKFLKF